MLTIYYILVYTKKQAFLINIFTIFRISAYCTKIGLTFTTIYTKYLRHYLRYNVYIIIRVSPVNIKRDSPAIRLPQLPDFNATH